MSGFIVEWRALLSDRGAGPGVGSIDLVRALLHLPRSKVHENSLGRPALVDTTRPVTLAGDRVIRSAPVAVALGYAGAGEREVADVVSRAPAARQEEPRQRSRRHELSPHRLDPALILHAAGAPTLRAILETSLLEPSPLRRVLLVHQLQDRVLNARLVGRVLRRPRTIEDLVGEWAAPDDEERGDGEAWRDGRHGDDLADAKAQQRCVLLGM